VLTPEGFYVKDLRVILNRDLKDMVLVDNSIYSFAYQIDNGIPIISFYDDPNDEELLHLMFYMKSLANWRMFGSKIAKRLNCTNWATTLRNNLLSKQPRLWPKASTKMKKRNSDLMCLLLCIFRLETTRRCRSFLKVNRMRALMMDLRG